MREILRNEDVFLVLRLLLLPILLLPVCVTDVRQRTIENRRCIALGGSGLLLMAAEAIAARPDGVSSLLSAAGGLLAAGVLDGLCRLVSREGFGLGDVKLILALGVFQGLDLFLRSMALTGLLTLAAALYLILVRRAERTETLPLAPFLAAGSVLAVLWALLL